MNYQEYKDYHKTRECRVAHLLGISLILFSLHCFSLHDPLIGVPVFFLTGVSILWLGHKAEGNKPAVQKDLMAIPYGVLFYLELWKDLFRGKL